MRNRNAIYFYATFLKIIKWTRFFPRLQGFSAPEKLQTFILLSCSNLSQWEASFLRRMKKIAISLGFTQHCLKNFVKFFILPIQLFKISFVLAKTALPHFFPNLIALLVIFFWNSRIPHWRELFSGILFGFRRCCPVSSATTKLKWEKGVKKKEKNSSIDPSRPKQLCNDISGFFRAMLSKPLAYRSLLSSLANILLKGHYFCPGNSIPEQYAYFHAFPQPLIASRWSRASAHAREMKAVCLANARR